MILFEFRNVPRQLIVTDMNRIAGDTRVASPAMQFALLLVPIVMNGFFMVYSLTGWILEGRDKRNWSLEADGVALWVCLGITLYSLLVLAFTRWKKGAWTHPLCLSSFGHILIAIILAASVFVIIRL